MQEPKAGRRIVSKGEYAARKTKRVFLFCVSLLLMLASVIGAFAVWWEFHVTPDKSVTPRFVVLLCILMAGCGYLSHWGNKIVNKARQVDTGVPLTRANAADLPAPDSLVRASQEPAQAQEGVLLRAASTEAQAGQEGQLLRASVGGQE